MAEICYYQTNTENKSFLRMAKFLKEKGIKNNKFFLSLYDKELMNFRPLDYLKKAPSKEMIARVTQECFRNPWYFLREIIRIPVPGGTNRYELNRGNLALTFLIINNIHTGLMMARQNGKTIGVVAILEWVFFCRATNTNMVFGNKRYDDAQLNVKRFSSIAELIPFWLKPTRVYSDKDSSTTYSLASVNNTITAMPSATNPESADKLGRGLTVPIVWFDEKAFSLFNSIIYASAAPAQKKAAEEAEKKGGPHCIIVTTTPNNIDLPEGQFCKSRIFDEACKFDEKIFYDMDPYELHDYVFDNSTNNFVYIEFSWRQLGHDERWYNEQCRQLLNDKMKIKREIDLEWTLSSDKSPFEEEELEAIRKFITPDEDLILVDSGYSGYKLCFIKPYDPAAHYILACDCSGGLSKDFSTICIIDAKTRETIGGFWSNRISTGAFKELIAVVAYNILINSVIVPERNSYGLNIIDDLVEDDRTRSKVFYSYKGHSKPGDVDSIIDPIQQKVYGIDTTVVSRDYMINTLFKYVMECPNRFRLNFLYRQIKTLERKRNGKIEHAEGEHDDMVMAFLIGQYALDCPSMKYFLRRNYFKRNIEESIPVETTRKIHVRSSEELYKRNAPSKQSKKISMFLSMNS